MSWMENLNHAKVALQACRWDACHQWLEKCLEEPDLKHRGLFMHNLALLFRKIADYDQAEACLEQGLECSKEAWLRGRLTANYGVLELRRGRFTQARKRFQEALDLASELPEDTLAIIMTSLNFSHLQVKQGHLVQAESLVKRARGLAQHYPDRLELQARVHLGVARVALAQDRLSRAEMELLQSIRKAQKMGHFEATLQAQARALLGEVYSRQAAELMRQNQMEKEAKERSEMAETLLEEARNSLRDWGLRMTLEYLECISAQADHWIRWQSWEKAEATLQRLATLCSEIRGVDRRLHASAWERAARVLHHLDRHDLALEATTQFQKLQKRRR